MQSTPNTEHHTYLSKDLLADRAATAVELSLSWPSKYCCSIRRQKAVRLL